MCKFPGKILMLATMALLLSVGAAVADPASSDWNNSWGFPTPFEKANLLDQALAIELVEKDGYNNQSNYYDSTSIENQIIAIDNSINDSVLDSFNANDSFNKTTSTTTTTTNNKTFNVDIDDSFNTKNGGQGHH